MIEGLSPAVLAVLSGLFLTLSFPRFGWPAMAWVALAPLLVALARRPVSASSSRSSSLRAFSLGLLAGFVYFCGTTYWTGWVMRQYGDLGPATAWPLMLLLAAYLALYPAFFALIVHRLVARLGTRALVLAPAAWVTTELGRGYLFTGFPWVLLGYSQVTVLPVAQLASLVGVFGLSGLVALVNAAVVLAVIDRTRFRWGVMAVTAALVAVTVAWGGARLADNRLTREGTEYRVGLIQGSVSQGEKWNPERAAAIVRSYVDRTRQAAAAGAQFVVWPESALPFFFQEEPAVGDAIRQLAHDTRTTLLFGSDQLERTTPPRYYNAAFLIEPTGTVAAIYRKLHLVPFGEYVPLKRLLFFAGPLVQAVSDFSEGDRMVMLPVAGHRVSTAICYEVVYPDLGRRATLAGSELLTTITNDAWFGYSSAPWQHFAMASMRAIEQGRYLARAANTGISGIVDPYGRVLARTPLFQAETVVGTVRFLTAQTVYGRTGDLFAYACAVAILAALLLSRFTSRLPTLE
jgi:apolipoprotein N-acyltransferase